MGTHTPIKKISLKELSEQAANDVRNGNPKCFLVDQYIKDAPNEMISSKTEGMLQLVGMLSKVCKVCGAAGADGYINPAITFAQSVKQGDHDETPMDEYEKINRCDETRLTPQNVVYGPPSSEKALKACCGEDTSAEGYKACSDDFISNPAVCVNPVPGSDMALEKCCGVASEEQTYLDCVENYKQNNLCGKPVMPPVIYGPPEDITPVEPKPEES